MLRNGLLEHSVLSVKISSGKFGALPCWISISRNTILFAQALISNFGNAFNRAKDWLEHWIYPFPWSALFGGRKHNIHTFYQVRQEPKKVLIFSGASVQGGLDLSGCGGTFQEMRYRATTNFQVCGNSAQALSALDCHFLQLKVWKEQLSDCQEDLGLSSAKFLSFVVFVSRMSKHFSRD